MARPDADIDFSLLYPAGKEKPSNRDQWGENSVEDLGLEQLAWDLSLDNQYQPAIQRILLELSTDIDVINYRQEILQDFLENDALAKSLQDLLPVFSKLKYYAESRLQKNPLQETLSRLTELNTYISCVRQLQQVLVEAGSQLNSRGLNGLRQLLEQVSQAATFLSLEKGLPEILQKLKTVPSISIGLNLDAEMKPVEATLLAIHDKPFRENNLFDRLLGSKSPQGIGPMHEVPHNVVRGLDSRIVPIADRADPLLVPLFRDLYEVLSTILEPIARELKQYAQVNGRFLIRLEAEVAFYLGALALIRQVRQAGLPMCRPQAEPLEARLSTLEGMHNLSLTSSLIHSGESAGKSVVLNDVCFSPQARIFILTGPNQGGKTVYTQGAGQAQVLFQAGLYVPARQARLSPVDGIFTHFARLEETDSGMGRLAEESRRLQTIFRSVTDKSLILLNESLSSTSPGESLYLARDVVRALKLFGVRAIFATHLHELAEGLDSINNEVEGDSLVASLVAGVAMDDPRAVSEEVVHYTYQIKPGPPRGRSFARGIALHYGISFEQLQDQWKQRRQEPPQPAGE